MGDPMKVGSWSSRLEVHWFPGAEVTKLGEMSLKLRQMILDDTGRWEYGQSAEVWLGNVRPFDEVVKSWATLRRLILKTILFGYESADADQDLDVERL